MQARRKLTEDEFKIITDYSPRDQAIRFSKKQLLDLGFSKDTLQQGGLVRVNGEVYSFVEKENNPNKSYILGEGLYGRVKLLQNVRNPKDQKALKVLFANDKPPIFSEQEDYQAFVKELNISIALDRASQEAIKKVGEKGHVSYCGVLDIIPGVPLNDFLKANKTNPDFTVVNRLTILLECLKELQWLHSHGYTHRDIHSGNFMYDDSTGRVKIIDFGKAQPLSSSAAERENEIRQDLSDFSIFLNSVTWNDKNKLEKSEKEKLTDLISWLQMEDMDSETIMSIAIIQLEALMMECQASQRRVQPIQPLSKESSDSKSDVSLQSSQEKGSSTSKHFLKRHVSGSEPKPKAEPAEAQDPVFMHIKKK